MKKTGVVLSIILFIILISFVFVSAAGSSTNVRIQARPDIPTQYSNDVRDVRSISNDSSITPVGCNAQQNTEERIKCRLQYARENRAVKVEVAGEDESCRGIASQERCRALYAASQRCYEMTNKNKTACFRNVIGLTNAAFRSQNQTLIKPQNQAQIREYLVLLLYEAQERAEERVASGEITAEQGARIINMIVETKQLILNGGTKAEVKAKMQSLRRLWNEVMP